MFETIIVASLYYIHMSDKVLNIGSNFNSWIRDVILLCMVYTRRVISIVQ